MCPIWIRYLRFFCLAVLALASSAAADYAIDNANSSVLYSVAPDGSGASWATYGVGLSSIILETGNTNITVDASKCYDENFALASCVTNDACQIEFPFTGSGVTIYILNAGFQGVSASLTVDNGQAVTTTIPPPNPPSYQTPNVSLFSIQSLSYDNHNAKVSLLDWNNQGTALYFDYALINESYVEPVVPPSSAPATTSHPTSTTAPTTSSTSSTPTPSSSSLAMNSTTVSSSSSSTTTRSTSATPTTSSTISGSTFANAPSVTPVSSPTTPNNDSVNLGLVIGSACGGVAAIALLLALVFYLKKRKHTSKRTDDDNRTPTPFPSLLGPPPPPSASAIASPSPSPYMSDKARLRLLHHEATFRQSRDVDSDSEDFVFPRPQAGGAGAHRAHESVSRTSTQETLMDGMIIDCVRDAAVPPLVPFAAGSTVSASSAVPPSYQTR